MAKLFTLFWGATLLIAALLYKQQGTPVVVIALSIASFTYGALLGGFFLGMLWRRAIQRDAILGMAVGIIASTIGFVNSGILSAPRMLQAMSADGLFFRFASRLHPTYRTPAGGILIQAGLSVALAVSGTYGQLLDYVVFGDWIFFGLIVATVFAYRRRDKLTGVASAVRDRGCIRGRQRDLVQPTQLAARSSAHRPRRSRVSLLAEAKQS